MKTITIKEFIKDNHALYTARASNELYELLVKNEVQRNEIYPYKKFVKNKIIFMHIYENTVHGNGYKDEYEEVLISELQIEPATYSSTNGWDFE